MTAPRRILVTDARLGSSTCMIRSLGRAGHQVVAAASTPRAAGLRSRYAWRSFVFPMPVDDPGAVAAIMRDKVIEHGIDLVVPITDDILIPLLDHRNEFDGLCELAVPPRAAIDVSHDKLKTVRRADELGIPVPRTVELAEVAHDLFAAGADLGWPIVVKPRMAHRPSQQRAALSGAAYANDAQDLQRLADCGAGPLILQSFCPGGGEAIGALAHHGRVVDAFQHRRVREFPLTGGPSSCRVGVPVAPELLDWTERLVAALRWHGLLMVEFRIGDAGACLMEINGRTWGSLPLATASGVDFPRQLAELYLGATPPTALSSYVPGAVSRNLELELRWALAVLRQPHFAHHPTPPRRAAAPVLLRAMWPFGGYDMGASDDWAPAVAEVKRVSRLLVTEPLSRRSARSARLRTASGR